MTQNLDPLKINERVYRQMDKLLTQLEQNEHVTLKERFAALMAIARIQYVFVNLRKERIGENVDAGSAVRKYSSAFRAANDAGRRKKASRAAGAGGRAPDTSEPDNILGLDDDGDAA